MKKIDKIYNWILKQPHGLIPFLLPLAVLSMLFLFLFLTFPPANAGNVVTMFKSQGADVTAPTVSTATIGTNGTTLTLGMSETVTRSGGTFDVDCATAGANLTATYSSGSGSSSLVYTIGTTVNSGDTCNLDYDGAGNGIEDGAGNDLAAITDKAITNNSTQGGGYATPAYVNSASAYTGSNTTITLNGVTNGNFLICAMTGGSGTPTISTTSGNTSSWTSAGSNSQGDIVITIWWAVKTTDTGNVTVTMAGSLTDPGAVLHEYSGVATSTPQEGTIQSDPVGTSDTSFDTAGIATSIDNNLLFGVWASESADATITAANGWTQRINETTHIHKSFDKVVTSGGTYYFNLNQTSQTGSAHATFVMFKAKAL